MTEKPKNKNRRLPFVFSNFAITADGKIAFASREFIPFGSDRDRENMMELRATADAVMAGARTVATPGVTLGPGGKKYQRQRLARRLNEYNLRVIVSGNGSMDPKAEIFKHRFSPIIVLVSDGVPEKQLRRLREVADEVKAFGQDGVDLPSALRWLYEKWNVKRLLCEGGSVLHNAMICSGLLDELHLTFCPTIFGGRDAPTIADGSVVSKLADAARFKLKSSKQAGNELFAVFTRGRTASF